VGIGDRALSGAGQRAVFLDRDGVIVEPVPDPHTGRPEAAYRAEDVAVTPGAAEGIQALREAGFRLVGASNQPGAAKGNAELADIEAVHDRAAELLAAAGAPLDDWRYCLHHPDGSDPELGRACDCRKPAPGLLLGAARDLGLDLSASWMVGDSDSDVEAGAAAGCRTVLVEHPGSAHRRTGDVLPTLTAADLWDAAQRILAAD
jgi:D-glycero-D-manno-heptose 1,7-bisphosphate phosphatase